MTTMSGYFEIVILNELRAPDSVNQNIAMMVFVAGGDDLEYQVIDTTPNMPYSPQSNPAFFDGFREQSGWDVSCGKEVAIDEAVGNFNKESLTTAHSSKCVGEHFTSVKQLLSRYNPVRYQNINQSSTSSQLVIWPWFAGAISTQAAGYTGGQCGGDIYSFVAPMYFGYRGAVRVNVCPVNTLNVNASANMYAQIAPSNVTLGTSLPINCSTVASPTAPYTSASVTWPVVVSNPLSGVAVTDSVVGNSSFIVPYYAKTRFSVVKTQTQVADAVPNDFSQPEACLNIGVPTQFSGVVLNRSFADEFQLSYFIGCPPLFISST
jgi:hypothetical protein